LDYRCVPHSWLICYYTFCPSCPQDVIHLYL
jgi:hypothetical protein